MVGLEGLELENGVNSRIVASEVIRFLGNAVSTLEETGFCNRWSNGDRTEYHLFSSFAPGLEPDSHEWDAAYEKSLKSLHVDGGRIFTDTATGKPIFASVHGKFAHVPIANPRVVDRAADSWYARIQIPTPKLGQTQRVVMDSYRMPMQSFWEHAYNTELDTDAKVAEDKTWYASWHKYTPQGIPVRAKDIAHDVLGRDVVLSSERRERVLKYTQHIGTLVANVCQSLLEPEVA